MRVRRLDDNHDWTFGAGRANYATQSEAIAQSVKTRLLSLKGDGFLNPEAGVRWFDYLKKNPDLMAMEAELKSTILGTDGVAALTAFSIQRDPDSRKYTISVTYTDIHGTRSEVSTDAPGNK